MLKKAIAMATKHPHYTNSKILYDKQNYKDFLYETYTILFVSDFIYIFIYIFIYNTLYECWTQNKREED